MEHRIERISKKILVGMKLKMSYIENTTALLWRSFMRIRNKVLNRVDNKYYSMQVYNDIFDYRSFDPSKKFTKWAAVEVSSVENLASEMETYKLSGGIYAVFKHIGPASAFEKSMKYIFEEWMPQSGYKIDNREHFELLEEGYNPMDESAKEEIWIPVVKC
ncbi:GyrI-like domain-containing protein [Tepidibacter aestuarii]|uniref:GyrI-like domain-containing protein n=1 Tax=Tepidibacter aestuarii TaxID=2925782 RepID=UPI0021111502|nr:GyrI-like domain-containing protein [Tepidibacter aestuarii]CAH2213542.1 Transcriptional regulator, AraC family [Tepidibacter aestuarii]